ncbi:endonuclease domain-containing protein [Roseiconus lacunae]|uniref:endonuclease domain-containing protein n=1 Tax=Roseiconus lacunae TaxID=2605694 RepID=UPI0011F24347|nr:DUF559 domain-containing protein [Roseiconus lacunae]
MKRRTSKQTQRAKELRQNQTSAEGLLWSVLRGKQLCELKFRRQHPIGRYFADFACVSEHLIIELDGEYHDQQQERDLARQQELADQGWDVIRFANDDVLNGIDSVLVAISAHLGIPFSHRSRSGDLGGMLGKQDPNYLGPTRPLKRPTSPQGR